MERIFWMMFRYYPHSGKLTEKLFSMIPMHNVVHHANSQAEQTGVVRYYRVAKRLIKTKFRVFP